MRERFDGHGSGCTWASGTGRTLELPNATAQRMASPQRYRDLKQKVPCGRGAVPELAGARERCAAGARGVAHRS
jgi:hypothetical protein